MTNDEAFVRVETSLAGMSIGDSVTATQAPAPIMPREDDVSQFFGPPMSKGIFAKKWHDKLCHLLDRYHLQPEQLNVPDPVWMCILCIEAVSHIRELRVQARDLKIKYSDFPVPTQAELDAEPPLPKSFALRCGEGDLKRWKGNPLIEGYTVMVMVDRYVVALQNVKLGGSSRWLQSWSSLPLRWRQAMNELFLTVEEGRQDGWWDMSDQFRDMQRRISAGEKIDAARMRSGPA